MNFTFTSRWQYGGWTVVFFFSLAVIAKLVFPGDLTRFGGFGSNFEHRYIPAVESSGAYIKADSGGYDGQFYAQIATDPLLNNPEFEDAIDEPAYRARRIALPAIAHLLSLGKPEISIRVYCAINLVLWFVFALIVWRWIGVEDGKGFFRWVCCVLSLGVLESIKYSLTDLPSIILLLLILKALSQRGLWKFLGYVGAVFTKETNLLFAAALPNKWITEKAGIRSWTFASVSGLVALGLFSLWMVYVHTKFSPFNGVSGNFDWPLVSMVRNVWIALFELESGNWDDRYLFRIIAAAGILIQISWAFFHFKKISQAIFRIALVYAALALCLGDLVWWGYWAVCRVILPLTILFNLHFNSKRWFWPTMVVANLTIIHACYRFF